MNPRFTYLIVLLSLFLSCKQEPSSQTPPSDGAGAEKVVQASGFPELANGPLIGGGLASPQTERIMRVLCTHHWVFEAYVKINDRESALDNIGRWYKFSPDGTFTEGRLKKTTGKGVWGYDPQSGKLVLDGEAEFKDGEFTLKISSDEQVMIWVGTERFAQNSIQIKLFNFIDLPEEMPIPREK